MAGVDTVVALVYQLWVEAQAAGFERLLESLKPGSSVAYAERTAHHGDGLMPDPGQVRDRFKAALKIVGNHRVARQSGVGAHHQHGGNIHAGKQADGLWAQVARRFGKQNAVHSFGHQQVQVKLFLLQKPVAVTEQNTVAALLRRILGPAHQHGEKWVGDIGDDHTERTCTFVGQALGEGIGPVIQLEDGGIHAFFKRGAHMTLVVDDRRHGEDGDPCFARYIVNGWCFTSGCP